VLYEQNYGFDLTDFEQFALGRDAENSCGAYSVGGFGNVPKECPGSLGGRDK
jgi:hypothetical protein